MNSVEKTDVLIVGAGPTGLTTAIELARRDISVRIIEQRTHPSTRSKALVVHARTLEFMDILGVADDLVKQGYTSPGIDFSADAGNPLRANMYGLDTRFPFILIVPQAETERILEHRLNELGVKIERGCTLTCFQEVESGVQATIQRHDHQNQLALQAHYLVGADGVNSTVREGLDLPFQGSDYTWTAFLGDIQLQGHHAEGGTEQHTNARGLAFIVPFEDGSHRIVTIDRKYQNEPQKQELMLSELQESISAILEKPVTLSDPKWLSRWGANLRLASQYRVGRVFIAGDAAHTHSPAGGQGMNTGIQDAFNLGWKLAFVLKGESKPELLDTFNQERHPIGEQVLKVSDILLRSLLLRQPLLRQVREGLFRIMIPLVQHQLAKNLSGLGVDYKTGEGQWAGQRIPDLELMRADHKTVRLYELLRLSGYALLVFVNPQQAQTQSQLIQQILQYNNSGLHYPQQWVA